MAVSASFRNVKGPAPVKSHIFVHRPYIRLRDTLSKLLFHFYLVALFGVLNAANTSYSLNVGSVLMDNFAEPYKKVGNALISSTLCKGKPVASRFVIDTEQHSAERTQVFCNCNKVIVRKSRVNSQCESNVLTVTSYVSHTGKRLIVGSTVQTAFVSKIVIIGIVPLERHVSVLHDLRNPAWPLLVKGVVAVHQANTAVRSAEGSENVVLINILAALGAVSQIERAFCLTHMNAVNFLAHSKKSFHK